MARNKYNKKQLLYDVKGIYELGIKDTEECLSYIRKNNPDIEIIIQESPIPKSKSLYVRFILNDCHNSLRISDHRTPRYATDFENTRNIVLGETESPIGKSNVCYKMQKIVDDLRLKEKAQQYNNLWKQISRSSEDVNHTLQ